MVDTLGLILTVVTGSAREGDRSGLKTLMARFYDIFLQLKLIWTDMGYSSSEMKNTLLSVGVRQEIVGGIKPKGLGF